jgi:hypothetical protein
MPKIFGKSKHRLKEYVEIKMSKSQNAQCQKAAKKSRPDSNR